MGGKLLKETSCAPRAEHPAHDTTWLHADRGTNSANIEYGLLGKFNYHDENYHYCQFTEWFSLPYISSRHTAQWPHIPLKQSLTHYYSQLCRTIISELFLSRNFWMVDMFDTYSSMLQKSHGEFVEPNQYNSIEGVILGYIQWHLFVTFMSMKTTTQA